MYGENTLIKREIDGIDFELVISSSLAVSKLEINGEPIYIEDEDLGMIIRAIMNCDYVKSFVKMIPNIKKCAWDEINEEINHICERL